MLLMQSFKTPFHRGSTENKITEPGTKAAIVPLNCRLKRGRAVMPVYIPITRP